MTSPKKKNPGLFGRFTGFLSNIFTKNPPRTSPPKRKSTPQRPSGTGAAQTARRPADAAPSAAGAAATGDTSHLSEVTFASFDLPESVRKGITDAGFVRCTPIQAKVLPLALAGQDVAGQAQTGTGKTAAFLVSTFTRLLRENPPRVDGSPRAFMLAPTRELVAQIETDAKTLGAHTGLKYHAVYGGVDYGRQREILRAGVDILIGTPGRLIDYYKQRVYNLDGVEVLVIDEADRMFDMGFLPDLRYLLRKLPPYTKRQSMLFSATLSWRVMELAYEHMNLPEKVEVAPQQKTADNVTQLLYHVGNKEKFRLLLGLLKRDGGARILIFVNTKVGAEAIVRKLGANGHLAAEISGDVPQPRRIKVLADFKEGRLPILVATDVAARGLHIEGVTHVYNYDIPLDPEDYVHRIGRTARAGASGHAISFACERYVSGLPGIEAFIGSKLPVEWADDSLYISEKSAPPRTNTGRLSEARDEHHRGAPRQEHGGGGHAAGRGERSRGGRPDRIDRVVGHHVTKEASLEAQLEAEGVTFEDDGAPSLRPAATATEPVPSPTGPRPAGDRNRRRRRRGGSGAGERGPRPEGQAARSPAPAAAPAGDTDDDLKFRDPDDIDADSAAPSTQAVPGADGSAPKKRRRRRRRKGSGGGTPGQAGESTAAGEDDTAPGEPDTSTAPGGFWNPA